MQTCAQVFQKKKPNLISQFNWISLLLSEGKPSHHDYSYYVDWKKRVYVSALNFKKEKVRLFKSWYEQSNFDSGANKGAFQKFSG